MFVLTFVLVSPSIVFLRRLAQSTLSLKTWVLQKLHIVSGDRTRKPRIVWQNPIAWREAKTKASAARASVLRYAFIAAGVVGAVVLVVMFSMVEEPSKYIMGNSYDPDAKTLTVYSSTGDADTYSVPGRVPVTIDGKEARLDDLAASSRWKSRRRRTSAPSRPSPPRA
jgi:hypothetical protein